jgi:hypothetical protein
MDNSIKVEAFDSDWNSVGVFEDLGKAARALFIRRQGTIWTYLFGGKGCTFTKPKRGVTSYKTGKKYHFKKVS